MKFLHISDTHYLKDYKTNDNKSQNKLLSMEDPTIRINKIKQVINEDIDFLIHTGNLTHNGDVFDYIELKVKIQEIFPKTPIYSTIGSSDNRVAFKAVFNDNVVTDVIVNEFENYAIIGIDNTVRGELDGKITTEICEKIENYLNNNSDKKVILYMHHHLIQEQSPLKSAEIDVKFEKIVENSNIIAILTGHTHENYKGEFGKKPYYTVGATSFKASGVNYAQIEDITCCDAYLFDVTNEEICVKEIDISNYVPTKQEENKPREIDILNEENQDLNI